MDEAASQVGQAVDEGGQRDPEEVRQDVEGTRREVGDTAAALAEKGDVKTQAKNKVEEIKGRLEGKREELGGRASDVAPESAGQAASTVGTRVRENPMPLVVCGCRDRRFRARASGRKTVGTVGTWRERRQTRARCRPR
jgi:Protein of unknown function (DUF3618)